MKYSEEQMELLKTILNNAAKKDKAKSYEILVGGLKAVEKTKDIDEFDSYLNFINEDSKQVEVRFFYTHESPKFKKHILLIGNTPPPVETKNEGLSGIEIQHKISEGIRAEREKWERDAAQKELQKELNEKNELIKENDKYIEELEKTILELRLSKNTIKGIHLGEVAGVAVEALIRNNVHLLEKIPATKALAGLIAKDNEEQKLKANSLPENAEVQFSAVQSPPTDLSDDDQHMIAFLKQLQNSFNENELKDLIEVIQKLSEDTTQIKTIKELLNNNK